MFKFKEVPILVLVCVGLSLFALFDRFLLAPLGWLMLVGLGLLTAYTQTGKSFRISRPLAVTLVVALIGGLNFAIFVIKVPPEHALVAFLTILILVKSFMLCKINDYAQVMFLSLLSLMTAGSHFPTHNFSFVAVLYMVLAGYTLYKFHLLSEILSHRRIKDPQPGLVIQTHCRNWFRSFLGAAIITCAIALAIFSFIPRGPGLSLSGNFGKGPSASTGFSQEIELGRMANILLDTSPVLRVKYISDKKLKNYNQDVYLRGEVLTQYVQLGNSWRWINDRDSNRKKIDAPVSNPVTIQPAILSPDKQNLWRISYEQVNSSSLFVIDRPIAISTNYSSLNLSYNYEANTLVLDSFFPKKGFNYELLSEPVLNTNKPTTNPASTEPAPTRMKFFARHPQSRPAGGPAYFPIEDDKKKVELDQFKPIAQKIVASLGPQASWQAKARKIESWLTANLGYTLNNMDVDRSVEPVKDFLTRRKHGHCEYFASAMVLLSRALGMEARIVLGFKGGEYNSFGDYLVVRNCDAHAWAEVYIPPQGWVRYDPTPSAREDFIRKQNNETFKWFWDIVDMVRYSWIEKLSDSFSGNRQDFMKNLQQQANDPDALKEAQKWSIAKIVKRIITLIKGQDYESVWLQVFHTVIFLLGFMLLALVVRIVIVVMGIVWSWLRLSLHHQWEERFGSLWFCPVEFYRSIMLWLAVRGITRTSTETAREFADRISQTFPQVDQNLHFITESYLAARFGKRLISPQDRNKLHHAAGQIQSSLATVAEKPGSRKKK
ncbi:MAG: DUF3488 and transglutaminase-like domain-containing protein [Phycisphaerae bacterium]